MRVAVRVRPLSPKELETSDYIVEVNHEDGELVVLDPSDATADAVDVLHRSYERAFNFEHMFGPSSTQTEVYAATIRDFIPFVLQGYNATVFAYGATGSGKTYTMLGTPSNPGLQWLAVRDLFDRVRQGEGTAMGAKIMSSYVEVYNEKIRDLFAPSNRQLVLRESAARGVIVAGVKEFEVKSVEDLAALLRSGNERRSQSATAANATSSRSHAVLQIFVRKSATKSKKARGGRRRLAAPTTQATPQSKLCMVDLAGSERAAKTQNRGIRLTEGAQINKSLLSLGKCINALVAKGGGRNKRRHIPYRESKLTRMLKDSLGGNCRTCMIASVKPHASSFKESLNTLKYAAHAINIKTKVRQVVKVAKAVGKFKAAVVAKRNARVQHRTPVVQRQQSMALPVVSPVLSRGGQVTMQATRQATRRIAARPMLSPPYESSQLRTYAPARAISPMMATKKVRERERERESARDCKETTTQRVCALLPSSLLTLLLPSVLPAPFPFSLSPPPASVDEAQHSSAPGAHGFAATIPARTAAAERARRGRDAHAVREAGRGKGAQQQRATVAFPYLSHARSPIQNPNPPPHFLMHSQMPLSKTMISRKALAQMQSELKELRMQRQQQAKMPRQQVAERVERAPAQFESLVGWKGNGGHVQRNAIQIDVPSSRFGGRRGGRRGYR